MGRSGAAEWCRPEGGGGLWVSLGQRRGTGWQSLPRSSPTRPMPCTLSCPGRPEALRPYPLPLQCHKPPSILRPRHWLTYRCHPPRPLPRSRFAKCLEVPETKPRRAPPLSVHRPIAVPPPLPPAPLPPPPKCQPSSSCCRWADPHCSPCTLHLCRYLCPRALSRLTSLSLRPFPASPPHIALVLRVFTEALKRHLPVSSSSQESRNSLLQRPARCGPLNGGGLGKVRATASGEPSSCYPPPHRSAHGPGA